MAVAVDFRRTIGDELEASGRSLRDVAKEADVNAGNFSRYLNDHEAQTIGTDSLERICRVLRLHLQKIDV